MKTLLKVHRVRLTVFGKQFDDKPDPIVARDRIPIFI